MAPSVSDCGGMTRSEHRTQAIHEEEGLVAATAIVGKLSSHRRRDTPGTSDPPSPVCRMNHTRALLRLADRSQRRIRRCGHRLPHCRCTSTQAPRTWPLCGPAGRLLGPFPLVGGLGQIHQPYRGAGIPFPAVGVCGVAAPTTRVGLMPSPEPSKHLRPLREQRQLTNERLEHLGGPRTTRRHDETTQVKADGLPCAPRGPDDVSDEITPTRRGRYRSRRTER